MKIKKEMVWNSTQARNLYKKLDADEEDSIRLSFQFLNLRLSRSMCVLFAANYFEKILLLFSSLQILVSRHVYHP